LTATLLPSPASAPASAVPAASTARAVQAWPAAREPESFPVAGALLLLVLLAVAAWAWLWGPRRRGQANFAWPLQALRERQRDTVLEVTALTRLDAQHSVAVLRWRDRELLIGLGGSSSPTVLDSRDLPPKGGLSA